MIDLLLFVFSLFYVLVPTFSSTCYDNSRLQSWDRSFYCSNGCCGSFARQYCCMDDGAVAGIVIGSLLSTAVVAAIIFACIRYHTRKSVIITPTVVSAGTVAVVTHGSHSSMYPTQAYPPGIYTPNTYSNPAFAPPPYSNTSTPTTNMSAKPQA